MTTAGESLLGNARIPYRVGGFAAYCIGLYVQYETLSRARGESNERQLAYIRRFGRKILSLWNIQILKRGPYVEHGDQVPKQGPNGKGRIFVSNHRSMFDIAVHIELCQGRHLSRGDLSKWPVIGLVARRAGVLFVERESKASGARAVREMVEQVEKGEAVIIYPEGTTFEGDEVRPFRRGAFTAATESGAEIVPIGVAYDGTDASFGDESFVQHMTRLSRAPGMRCAAVVGEPIPSEGVPLQELSDRVRAAVQDLVHQARRVLNENPA